MEKKPKIVYLSNTRLPTAKAHGIALAKICEAFEELDFDVDIVAPKLWRGDKRDFYDFYKVKRGSGVTFLSTLDFLIFPIPQKISFFIQIVSFSISAFFYCRSHYKRDKNIIFFSHDHIPLFFLSFLSHPIYYDVHHFPGTNFFYRRVINKSCGFATQTKWKIKALGEHFGIPKERIVYWPNGTDVGQFAINKSQKGARAELGLTKDSSIVLYQGSLHRWKGVEVLLKAAKDFPPTTLLYIVGGGVKEIDLMRKRESIPATKNVIPVPFQDHSSIPLWLRAADVLVLPNTGKQKVSQFYTSPMKLFEYMASGTPIVASDISSIREILSEKNAFFAEADNPSSFAERINYALEHSKEAYRLGAQATRDVQEFTWTNRALKITNHMKSLSCLH